MNTRIKQVSPNVEAEALAQTTVLQWNFRHPEQTSVQFRSEWHYRVVGTEEYFGQPDPDGVVSLYIGDILTLGPDPNGTTPEAVMGYLKWLFDKAHNVQRAEAISE